MSASHDEDRLLHHDYDGIQEYDNPMPRWWLYIFWGTIVWAALFWFNVPASAWARDASPITMRGRRRGRRTPNPFGPWRGPAPR
jgi:cbb3-type cytochrome c oxidase subunit III